MSDSFTHKFTYPLPVDGLGHEWQVAEIEGEADVMSVQNGKNYYVGDIKVWVLTVVNREAVSKLHTLPLDSRLKGQLLRWLMTKHDDMAASHRRAKDANGTVYENEDDEHRQRMHEVL